MSHIKPDFCEHALHVYCQTFWWILSCNWLTILYRHGPLSMAAPEKKVRKVKEKKTGEKPGAAAKVTPEQVCHGLNHVIYLNWFYFEASCSL